MKIFCSNQFSFILVFLLMVIRLSNQDSASDLCYQDDTYMYVRVQYGGAEMTVCLARADNIQNCGLYYTTQVVPHPYRVVSISTLTCPCDQSQNFIASLTTGGKFCMPNEYYIAGCPKYKQVGLDFKCAGCPSNQKLNSFGQCTTIISQCYVYNANGVCDRCNTGYILKGNSCIRNIDPHIKIDPGCADISAAPIPQGQCKKCKYGYLLLKGICYSVTNQNDAIDNIIGKCKDSQIRSLSGDCVQAVPNCNQYNYDGLCLICKTGFKFNDLFTECIDASTPDPAKICDGATKQALPQGLVYKIINGNCIQVDENCIDDPPTETGCVICKQSYFPINGRCYFVDLSTLLEGY